VIYPELAHQIIRDTPSDPTKQADKLFAGSEGVCGFKSTRLLLQCSLLHHNGMNQMFWRAQQVIYLVPAPQITRGAPPLSEVKFMAFKMPNYCSGAGMHHHCSHWEKSLTTSLPLPEKA
jgi:hypothetical protein